MTMDLLSVFAGVLRPGWQFHVAIMLALRCNR